MKSKNKIRVITVRTNSPDTLYDMFGYDNDAMPPAHIKHTVKNATITCFCKDGDTNTLQDFAPDKFDVVVNKSITYNELIRHYRDELNDCFDNDDDTQYSYTHKDVDKLLEISNVYFKYNYEQPQLTVSIDKNKNKIRVITAKSCDKMIIQAALVDAGHADYDLAYHVAKCINTVTMTSFAWGDDTNKLSMLRHSSNVNIITDKLITMDEFLNSYTRELRACLGDNSSNTSYTYADIVKLLLSNKVYYDFDIDNI